MTDKKFDSEKLIKHLGSKWKGKACPMCGVWNWTVTSGIFELREFNDGNFIIGNTPIFPVVPIMCDNCWNTILISALKSDLISQQSISNDK